MTLWASTQDPFTLQRHIAEFFSIAINKVTGHRAPRGRRLRRQALGEERASGGGAGMEDRPDGEDHPHVGGYLPHHHPASLAVPHQDRRHPGRAAGGAGVRGLHGHRGLRGLRTAGVPESRLPGTGAVPHPQRQGRRLHGLHQRRARRSIPGLRHAAGHLGLRVPDGHDRPQARHRSRGVPGPESVEEGRRLHQGRHPRWTAISRRVCGAPPRPWAGAKRRARTAVWVWPAA